MAWIATLAAVALAGRLGGAATTSDALSTQARVTLQPGIAKLGERVVYRVEIVNWQWSDIAWGRPDSSESLSWGAPRFGRSGPRTATRRVGNAARFPSAQVAQVDTMWIEYPLQAFELGTITVPGIPFQYREQAGQSRIVARAPTTRLIVVPVMTPADSQATLREVHGPLAAPWWERVPWTLVIAALLILVAVLLLIRMLRRRRPAPAVVMPARVASPIEAALAALAELRARRLPEHDRIAEHAFHLGQILRRFLESTVGTPRPGDTTRELVARLEQAGLGEDDVRRLAGLLRGWDQIKFAREPATREEALRMESAVEAYVRRGSAAAASPARREVA
jgi:hypothetical protein